ncbi:uncharacterized protein B0H18DRAFT_954568 [Fomitopsis serialis]|uniref:uncharacterized protein n=1 Tax=Fomitopsis serialis TaxID=139415 RepID=UPI00200746E1|nr:uncharacterized protein B0H18DRAFT_954568 [Neoantrodia serialis]KAH9926991.1 hypothetical protein B0H18DRAFT_954568 [Neoantrodia serialis]
MSEPSQNSMSGLNPMNAAFQDPTTSQYSSGGTRSDLSESIGSGTNALLDTPVDMGRKMAVGDPKPSSDAQGGATYDPASQMTAQSRYGSRRDADLEEAKKLPGAEGPTVKGNKSAVEDIKQEVGYVEGQLGSVATQTRN